MFLCTGQEACKFELCIAKGRQHKNLMRFLGMAENPNKLLTALFRYQVGTLYRMYSNTAHCNDPHFKIMNNSLNKCVV